MNISKNIYNKDEIIKELDHTFQEVSQMVTVLGDDEFYRNGGLKWSAAENLDHLIRSTKALASALKMPKLALYASFGKANRPSRTFQELMDRYQSKLKQGAKATGPYIPENTKAISKADLLESWQGIRAKFNNRLSKNWTEDQLDKSIVPHPLLGKMTMRKMMFFTIYHNLHHLKNIKSLYASFV